MPSALDSFMHDKHNDFASCWFNDNQFIQPTSKEFIPNAKLIDLIDKTITSRRKLFEIKTYCYITYLPWDYEQIEDTRLNDNPRDG